MKHIHTFENFLNEKNYPKFEVGKTYIHPRLGKFEVIELGKDSKTKVKFLDGSSKGDISYIAGYGSEGYELVESTVSEARSPEVTYNEDPKAMVAFNESKGPYKARLVFYNGKNGEESVAFPGLGDRALNMLVAGPGFRAEWAKQLGIDEGLYDQVTIDANVDELIDLAKKAGFKKARGDAYEKDARTPEDALKELVAFFKPLVDKLKTI